MFRSPGLPAIAYPGGGAYWRPRTAFCAAPGNAALAAGTAPAPAPSSSSCFTGTAAASSSAFRAAARTFFSSACFIASNSSRRTNSWPAAVRSCAK
jgi:hypothetical protein